MEGCAEAMVDMARFRHLLVHLDWHMDYERLDDRVQDRLASVEAYASHIGQWLQEQREVFKGRLPGVKTQRMSTDLTNRRQHAALLVAAQCAAMLLQRYGARRVIPFGSLVGDAPWHQQFPEAH